MEHHPAPERIEGDTSSTLISYEAPAVEAYESVVGMLSKTPSGTIVPP